MAIGDIVQGLSAANTLITFQPAGATECAVISYGSDNTAVVCTITDGVANVNPQTATTETMAVDTGNMHLFINNGHYFTIPAAGGANVTAYNVVEI